MNTWLQFSAVWFLLLFSAAAVAGPVFYHYESETLTLYPSAHLAKINRVCLTPDGKEGGTALLIGKYRMSKDRMEFFRVAKTEITPWVSKPFHLPAVQIYFQKSDDGWKEVRPYPSGIILSEWHGAACTFGLSGANDYGEKGSVVFAPGK